MNKNSMVSIASLVMLLFMTVSEAPGVSFTLSDEALMCLDYYEGSNGGKVVGRRNISGSGVEFDIYFSKNEVPENSCYYLSGKYGGAGILSGIDVNMYDNYNLKFRLLSVNGANSGSIGESLVVGAYLGDVGRYRPVWLNFGQGSISSTPLGYLGSPDYDLDVHDIDFIGYTIYLYGDRWSDTGTNLTILVEPAPGAVAIAPESTTIILLGFGSLIFLRKKKHIPQN